MPATAQKARAAPRFPGDRVPGQRTTCSYAGRDAGAPGRVGGSRSAAQARRTRPHDPTRRRAGALAAGNGPQKEREARKATQQRADRVQEHAQDALRQQAQAASNRERYQQRNAQHDQDEVQRASVQLRSVAENERRYRDKQERAKAYAANRAREREENQKARDERERKRKAQMLQETTDAAQQPQEVR